MSLKNAYPELPVLEYDKTSVQMDDVIAYIKKLVISAEAKAGMYTMFRWESGNGKSGVNNNYTGIQADGNRWAEKFTPEMAGTVTMPENKTGKTRIFIAFKSFEGCIDMLADRVVARGLFVGGITHKVTRIHILTPEDWAVAYKREWVTGNPKYNPTAEEIRTLASTYRQGLTLFK